MFPQSIRELQGLTFWVCLISSFWLYLTGGYHTYAWPAALVATGVACSSLAIIARWAAGMNAGPVDVWQIQEKVMRASNQRLPMRPLMTNESLLYFALIAEEAAEGFGHASGVLERVIDKAELSQDHPLVKIGANLYALGETMQRASREIRNDLGALGTWSIPLQLGEAIDLLDDCNDLVVVAAGESLTLGLPGREGFQEVCTSNLSKRNPDTGKIDKTPDGKWIKGRAYRPPNLRAILVPYYLDDNGRMPETVA